MKKIRFSYLVLIFAFLLVYPGCSKKEANEGFDCFSILAGREATIDGSVMFAHDEDDGGKQVVNWYKVPSLKHSPDEVINFRNGGVSVQPEETNSYLWLEMPGMSFSDSYLNQYGVCIGSDACSSREKEGVLTDGGIGYSLRRIMAERSKTAREAVKIGGELVSNYGYTSSGRTYCVADPNEAWMLSVVNGKHWIAQRIPDNHIAVIPNYYTIREIDLADTLNFLGSADIVEYAIEREWYNPDNGPFIFREAYSDSGSLKSIGNIYRMWRGINMLSEVDYDVEYDFPFSFEPEQKIGVKDFMKVLRDHYEGTDLFIDNQNPHLSNHRSICSNTNQYGFVAQLRSKMPVEIGAVLWIAPRRPCIQSFIPWYSGITKVPDGFGRNTYDQAIIEHFNPPPDIHTPVPELAYWHYYQESEVNPDDYENYFETKKTEIDAIENSLFKSQDGFEKEVLKTWGIDKEKALQMITDYTAKWVRKTFVY
ncbi:MAG: C69 family dipeptidase [Bacteroidetes bacterium]|nr:C69 family dipeptidase [Bacteroidota bacterium]